MNCDAAGGLIEPWAAGEIELSDELGTHLDACPRCAAALVLARQINECLGSRVQAPPSLTANVLARLPSRAWYAQDGLEAWFDTVAALSLLPVIVGIWFLADPALLRHMIDPTKSAVLALSGLLLELGAMRPIYVAIAVMSAMAVSNLDFEEAG